MCRRSVGVKARGHQFRAPILRGWTPADAKVTNNSTRLSIAFWLIPKTAECSAGGERFAGARGRRRRAVVLPGSGRVGAVEKALQSHLELHRRLHDGDPDHRF